MPERLELFDETPAAAENCVIVFGRYPVAGRTKTRLIPVLGPAGAADLQRRLTEKALKTVSAAAWITPFDVQFCFSGGSCRQVRDWLRSDTIGLAPQSAGNLGERMYQAMADAFNRGYRRVVLIGTDVPDLSGNHLTAAFEALNRHDVVLGPSTDGGYWLVGLRRKLKIFSNIAWSGPAVLRQTLALAQANGWTAHCMEALTDIDTPADLYNWQPRRQWQRPYLSVVIPVLDEAGHLRKTIAAARTADSEVIVADGGSRDGSAELAREAGAMVIRTSVGRALQLNAGAREAEGRVLLFLHADTLLPKGFVTHVFETLMDSEVSLGAFEFRTDLDRIGMRMIEIAANLRSRLFQLPYGDQGLFMKRDMFEALGGFPEVPIAEDLYLARQAATFGKVKTIHQKALTSARRWKKNGLARTTFANYVIAAGCLLGKSPHDLARLRQRWLERR